MQNTENYSIIKNDSRLTLAKDWISNLNISQILDLDSLRTASEDASFKAAGAFFPWEAVPALTPSGPCLLVAAPAACASARRPSGHPDEP